MNCPRPESLSRWADSTLPPRERRAIRAHLDRCDRCRARVENLRAAAQWLRSVSEEGGECLSVEGMAALLEGKTTSRHVETCPRCAAEFQALRSAARPATTRIYRRRISWTSWSVAGAVAAAAVVLVLMLPTWTRPPEEPEVVVVPRAPSIPSPAAPIEAGMDRPEPPTPNFSPVRKGAAPKPGPKKIQAPTPSESPKAAPVPAPAPPKPEPTDPRKTIVEAGKKPVEVAVRIQSGGLSTLAGGRWKKTGTVTAGLPLRADGRTRLEFAKASLTLDGSSKFSLKGTDLTLREGRVAAAVDAGSEFALDLDGFRIVPEASVSRVLLSARPDRVAVHEGFAVCNEIVLHEGEEHRVREGRLQGPVRNTLARGGTVREFPVWNLDLKRLIKNDRRVQRGAPVDYPEGRVLQSEAPALANGYSAQISYLAPDPADGFITVRERAAIRFRYFLLQPARLKLVMWNITKDENFEQEIKAVAGKWTTVTLYFRDIPPNPGGRKVICDAGDRYRSISLNAGKQGDSTQLLVDRLEVVEIVR